ncbi:MAG: ribokinase, partial [Alphaproteobacteria bacterium]|nr:ribokinase [Alphaproteobacteria bacterium]
RDARGENHIVVATGANSAVTNDQIPDEILKPGNIVLVQLEVPIVETETMIRRAHERGARTILNLSPMQPIDKAVLAMVDTLIMNEFEAEQALEYLGLPSGTKHAQQALALSRATAGTCIITLGAAGSVAVTKDGKIIEVPALDIDEVVDTAGAGDAYCGTMAACLHEGKKLEDAMRWAAVAGSLACREAGTQESFVYMGDIEEHLPSLGPSKIT